MTKRHKDHYRRALERIPWATQTHAKRWRPEWGTMPPFIRRAEGCRLWDLDDREYIDYRCALGPIILGYRHPRVEAAVRRQMENGVLFSMASPLELHAAEAIRMNVPWIEQIRFMKTGADACMSCIRLARAFTGRDHILTSGYHGYQDWFAVNQPNSGVPAALKAFVHEITYGNVHAVEEVFSRYGHALAAAIVVPCEWNQEDNKAYLELLRRKCDEYGTLLVFDEILTGFRLARGGAQEYYGITPDLAAYAKAMANGYPVSAFAGKREFMQALEKTVITTTYAGETLSLAACIATMQIMQSEPVHEHIFAMGQRLKSGFAEIIAETGAPAHAAGLPPAPFLAFDTGDQVEDQTWQDHLFNRLFEHGIFPNERWFINYAHQPDDIDKTLEAVRSVLKDMV